MSDCAIKGFLKDKIAISLNVRDLFETGRFKMHFIDEKYEMTMNRRWEGRVIMLGFTWKMTGDYKSKEKRGNNNANGNMDIDDGGF